MTKRSNANAEEDLYAQAAGGIGSLAVIFGILAAIKDNLGLSWPATVLLTAGVLVALGYGIYRARTGLKRLLSGEVAQPSTTALKQEAAQADAAEMDAEVVPAHPELTAVLSTAARSAGTRSSACTRPRSPTCRRARSTTSSCPKSARTRTLKSGWATWRACSA
ncbi:hypothetical protein [Streptomyces phaeoluteigriseus]|uniref:hypothetical protein n=1 Tax=Streptomyces phaeoluteigriseus TaxID=114686 RepID=UPI0011805BF1|nr:hypothetical protein [Streptomyces phaeoluteigriseus]